jgi:hypothetical protein
MNDLAGEPFMKTVSALLLASAVAVTTASAGPWTTVPSGTVGKQANSLSSVAAVTNSDGWAVGWSFDGRLNAYRTLIERWNGGAFTVVSSPNASNGYNLLNGAAAVGVTDVWAVGQSAVGSTYSTLIEHWNGSAWSIVPSPNVAGRSNVLQAITVLSASDIWAVGNSQDNNFANFALAMHWDGQAWTIVPTPTVNDDMLLGVHALASNDVWAVGRSNQEARTLTMHWNGSAWTVVPSPNGIGDNVLLGVVALAPADVWAVGNEGSLKTLAIHWNGASWSIVPTPAFTGNNNNPVLVGLVALPSGELWAAGQFLISSAIQQTLTEHWDGTSWTIEPSPNARNSNNRLHGIAVTPGGTLWAVGTVGKFGKPEKTLALQKMP